MSNERMQILQMLQEGKITAEEAERLLSALDVPVSQGAGVTKAGSNNKWLRVRVVEEGRQVVNVNLPMSVVDVALTMGLKFVPNEHLQGIDVESLLQAIRQGVTGKIVEIDEGDTKVEVIVE